MTRFYIFLFLALLVLAVVMLSDRFPGTLEDDHAFAHIIRLLMVLLLVAPGVFFAYRGSGSRAVKHMLVWCGIFVLAFVAMSYREEFASVGRHLQGQLIPSAPVAGEGNEVFLTRAENGHFFAEAFVNGQRVRFMVDTGASRVALSYEDAQRIGLDMDGLAYTIPISTANGMTLSAATTLDYVMLGDLRVGDVKASVAKPGQLSGSLLGLSYLDRLGGYSIEGNRMRIWQ